jgi:hypothetical protein
MHCIPLSSAMLAMLIESATAGPSVDWIGVHAHNPSVTAQIGYKEVDRPKNSLPLGEMLGHSVLTAAQAITTSPSCELSAVHDTLLLPRVDASVSISYQCRREFDPG